MGLKIRCVKKKIMPFEWTMRVYYGEEGRQHAYEDSRRDVFLDGYIDAAVSVEGPRVYVWVQGKDAGTEQLFDIMHEALHVTTYVWDYAGADLHFMKNDEVLTYTQTYIAKMILEAIEVLK